MYTITPPVIRLRTTLVLGLLTAAVLSPTTTAGASPAEEAARAPQLAQQPAQHRAVQRLETTLWPSGDPDGSGEAHLTLDRDRGRVCATITWHDIAQPDSAHIHRRSDGQIVVDLSGAVNGGARCAANVGHRLIGKVLAHPRKYYVNVHNPTYPAGAIQGTLHR